MKKKILIFLTVITVAIMALTVVACGNDKGTNDGDNTECTHTYGEWVTVDAPTCTTAGSKKRTCSECGAEEKVAVEATGHSWGEWKTTKEVTCTEDGSKKRECQVCNLPETEKVPMLGHNYVDGVCLNCGLPVPTATSGLEYALNDDGESYSVIGIGTATDANIVIPATYNDKPVTSIGDYSIYYSCVPTSIVIPDSVTRIGEYAFCCCERLTSISIPDSVISIGSAAFEGTAWYDNQPDGVVYAGKVLYRYKGKGTMPDNTSIEILPGTKGIVDWAFNGCSGLISITIPDSVISIGYYAFGQTAWYDNQPDGVLYVGKVLYEYKGKMPDNTSIEILPGTKGIAGEAFDGCSGLTSINIPDSVTFIGRYAFMDCSGLESITVGENNSVYRSENNCLIERATKMLISGCKNSIIPTDGSVTSIGEDAFLNCSELTSINIPDSITSIGSHAFNATPWYDNQPDGVVYAGKVLYTYKGTMPENTSIEVLPGTKSITAYAFSYCSELISITIPDSVTSIGREAFVGCSGLESIFVGANNPVFYSVNNCLIEKETGILILGCKNSVIPTDGSVTSIGSYAFYNCSELTSITIPDSVTSIGRMAFSECSGLASVTIGKGLTSIGFYAFSGCTALTSISLPDSVKIIDTFAFSECSGLTSITIPDSVKNIGGNAFYECSGLTSITIPDSVESIGFYAFSECIELTSITIGNGVTYIGYGAFSVCPKLTSITIPDSVTFIGRYAFEDCSGLESITVAENNSVYHTENNCLIETTTKTLIAGFKNSVIPTDGSVTKIGESAFSNCSELTSIEIPDGVTSIGESAFEYCGGLTSVTIGKGLTSIGSYAFSNCSGLTSINIPNGVTSIGSSVFSGCSGLTSIEIPDGVTSIGDYAFSRCSGLTSITIPDSVTKIGEYAFSNCSGLTSITIPDSVESIGYHAFSGCSGLTSITIGKGVTSIGEYAFYNCSGLTSITIPDSVESIGEYAFSSCSGLTSITIPDSVTSIGKSAFSGCSGLTSITIGKGVTSIGDGMFRNCSGLESITIPDNVTSIGEYAFSSCSGLTSITIPDSITSIGTDGFNWCFNLAIIDFDGTVEEWQGISKNDWWDNGTGDYTVYCTDGKIAKDGTVKDYKTESEPTSGLEYTLNDYGESYSVTGIGTATDINIVIPSRYNGKPVISIGYEAFSGCSGLTSIEIPDSVTNISNFAFSKCSGLTSIEIPDSVRIIDPFAFSGCSGLTSIEIHDSVMSIGAGAFSGCSGLTSIAVGENNANYHSKNNCLIEIETKILIAGCKNSVIPTDGSVTSIGYSAFYNCSGLTSINIPDSVTSIGKYSFEKCSGLTSIMIGNGVTSIGYSAFYGCSGLTSIEIPDSVTSIGSFAFSGTAWYNNQPDGVVYAGKVLYTYKGTMPDNTSIEILAGTKGIADGAFSSCTGLTRIGFAGTVAEWQAISKGSNWDNGTGDYTVYCTDGEIAKDGTVTYY